MPISDRLAMMVKEEVIGVVFSRLPIIRRSCSLFRL